MDMSKIANTTTTVILNAFAGLTVHRDEISAQITLQYAMAQKKTGVSSYFQVFDLIEAAGAAYQYTGPDYTGDCLYTFPVSA